jgi:major membrane immunogen (membrane-anchored lipoprotein)
MNATRSVTAALAAALLLAACGSSDDGPTETAQQREDRTASASIEGLMAFMRTLTAVSSEQAEPRPVDGITPPASDAAEPQPL